MTHRPARTRGQRTADSLAMLDGEVDVWVATASEQDGVARPHLVPVSLAWFEERVVIAVQATSRTALDLSTGGVARLGVGPTRDVVMIDVVLDESHPVESAPPAIAERFAQQADWDPRTSTGYLYVLLRPVRVQAWREADEIPGRTLMRDGEWLESVR